MSHSIVPHFPSGFIFATKDIACPNTFERGPILENFYIHPWAEVEAAEEDHCLVIIIGTCIMAGSWDRPAANVLLNAFKTSQEELFARLSQCTGRYVVIFGTRDRLKIIGDATGMRSVFYSEDGNVVASHALLAERATGEEAPPISIPFRYGYPGNRTPYRNTRILTANTYLDTSKGAVRRYWPHGQIVATIPEAAAASVLKMASDAMVAVAKISPVKLSLTGGLDSRMLLAVALHSGIEFEAYTYGRGADTAIDRALAADIAKHMGVKHAVVPPVKGTPALLRSVEEAHYSNHHRTTIPSMIDWIGDHTSVAASANLLEIGRSFYKSSRRIGRDRPTTPIAMAQLHYNHFGKQRKEEVGKFGKQRFFAIATEAFADFIAATGGPAPELLDPFDQFYWEHRMSAWHGPSMLERDYYARAFIPFNSRAVFEQLLGVSQDARDAGAVSYALINMVDPRLLDLPINPTAWPPIP